MLLFECVCRRVTVAELPSKQDCVSCRSIELQSCKKYQLMLTTNSRSISVSDKNYRPGWLVRYIVGPYDYVWLDSLVSDILAGITVALTLIPQGNYYLLLIPLLNIPHIHFVLPLPFKSISINCLLSFLYFI